MNETYLAHHGIKGMKWGVRRTPEQLGHRPLKYHRIRTLDTAKVAAITAGRYALAYTVPGAALLLNAQSIASMTVNAVKEYDGKDYTKSEGAPEKLSELRKKTTVNDSIIDDLKAVNPRIGQQKGTIHNCVNCTVAMEMRRRGYDVVARKKAQGVVEEYYNKWFKNFKLETPQIERLQGESNSKFAQRSYENLCKSIESCGDNSRGYVGITYEKGLGGHSMYWEVKNGVVNFYDGQSKSTQNDRIFVYADPAKYSYARLDNLKITNQITETVRSNPKMKKE